MAWINNTQTRKWRSDALESRLYAAAEASALVEGRTDEEAAEAGMEAVFAVMSWLYSRPYAVVVEMVEESWGVKTSLAALSAFWQRFSSPFLQERMRRSTVAARMLESELDAAGVQQAALELLTQRAFDVMSSPNPSSEEIFFLFKSMLENKRLDQNAQKLELDQRKVRLLEEKARRLDELEAKAKELQGGGGLSEETLAVIEQQLKLL